MAGIHDKHRQRLKERYLQGGLDLLEPHVTLELLLGYSIPRKDTNPCAHALIKKFGTLRGVLDAGTEELVSVKGITEHSAVLIRLCGDLSRRYALEEPKYNVYFRTVKDAAEFIIPVFRDQEVEAVWLFCLSGNMRLKAYRKIYEGDVNTARFRIKDITETAFRTDSPKVVIAHNHPGGSPIPSGTDLDTTWRIRDSLASNSIELIEHFIVGGENYTPVILCTEGGSAGKFHSAT
ncbi:MAG: JAB domain-containing protein [Eubacteriales bacterium]|nr:JAB domain-containing protein [Eubacteriales bacterium]